uniref:Endonuclease/exonuclease/phosphatase family protein n=1 Tax=Jahnella sp. MSr9139 TaxID=1434086 RepID=A0A3Q8I296_9BACT|nr:endonuclease/exonuclease/phosphatase family protein [Jahnella sp. MSr9139]
MSRRLRLTLPSLASLVLAACVAPLEEAADDPAEAIAEVSQAVVIPPRGGATTLDIGEWNIEWFGSSGLGPADDALQLQNARDVISGADLDLWAVEEIVSASQFSSLIAQLPGYAGFLANDPSVIGGSSSYTSGEQKVGVIYKPSVATIHSAKIILASHDYEFAGRPPLEVSMTVTAGGASTPLIFIVLHAKAASDLTSYTRRKDGSAALKAYLDSTYPGQRVIVAGDVNDDVDTSITSGQPSPYANFVADMADYLFPTKALSDVGQRSTVSYAQMIDHHLITNELLPFYVAGSAEVYRVDQYISSYGSTTSDHYPTLTRYALTGADPGPAQVILNEILANEPGSSTSGEFVEIVNVGGAAANLSGWTLSDAGGVRHTFAAGTSLPAGGAVVVFGGASGIPAGVSGAVVASSGGLSLNNSSDTVTLANASGAVVNSFTYDSALASVDGVSMNRSPDASPGPGFTLHTALSAASASPGKRASGSSF